jgi:hypothetical protein
MVTGENTVGIENNETCEVAILVITNWLGGVEEKYRKKCTPYFGVPDYYGPPVPVPERALHMRAYHRHSCFNHFYGIPRRRNNQLLIGVPVNRLILVIHQYSVHDINNCCNVYECLTNCK